MAPCAVGCFLPVSDSSLLADVILIKQIDCVRAYRVFVLSKIVDFFSNTALYSLFDFIMIHLSVLLKLWFFPL